MKAVGEGIEEEEELDVAPNAGKELDEDDVDCDAGIVCSPEDDRDEYRPGTSSITPSPDVWRRGKSFTICSITFA